MATKFRSTQQEEHNLGYVLAKCGEHPVTTSLCKLLVLQRNAIVPAIVSAQGSSASSGPFFILLLPAFGGAHSCSLPEHDTVHI